MLGPRVEMLGCSNSDSKLQIRARAQVWILGQGLQCVLQTWRGPLTGMAWHRNPIKLTFQANIIRLFSLPEASSLESAEEDQFQDGSSI